MCEQDRALAAMLSLLPTILITPGSSRVIKTAVERSFAVFAGSG
jgi:hypothetical protein